MMEAFQWPNTNLGSQAYIVKPPECTPEPTAEQATTAASQESVAKQLRAARQAQKDWAERTLSQRLSVLKSLRLKIACAPVDLARSVDRHELAETLAAEVLPLLDAIKFLENEAVKTLCETSVGSRSCPKWLWGNKVRLRREPLGVVLIIAPSNYPLMLPGIQLVQAIAAGNGVLIKPAKNCSQAMQSLADLAVSVGLPNNLIQILPESVEAAIQAIRLPVDKVVLTGSERTGRLVGQELANFHTPSVMELSGCDAVFVLDDADLNLVADCLLFGLMLNHGKTCMAPRRVFAKDSQVDHILNLITAKLRTRKYNPAYPIGCSLDDKSQLAIHDAIRQGASLVWGELPEGNAAGSSCILLDYVTADMTLVKSDIFAPIISFIRVSSAQDALQLNDCCPYALGASVFGSTKRSQQFAGEINAGCVVINDLVVPTADPRVPLAGRGMSGHGVTRGQAGLLEMTQLKAVVTSRPWFKPHLAEPTEVDAVVLEQLIRMEHAANPLQTLAVLPRMIGAMIQQRKFRGKAAGA